MYPTAKFYVARRCVYSANFTCPKGPASYLFVQQPLDIAETRGGGVEIRRLEL